MSQPSHESHDSRPITVIYYCSGCNSTDLKFDAWAEWCEYTNKFELATAFEEAVCQCCSHVTRPERAEVPTAELDAWKVANNIDQ